MDGLAEAVHGQVPETVWGVLETPIQLARGVQQPGAQWTGLVTSLCLSLLETKTVDAVVCIGGNGMPVLARTPAEVLQGRGVKPFLAPSLAILDDLDTKSIRKLLFCGVGCSVQALRALKLDLDELYVLGTNCVDNSPTREAANRFMEALGGNVTAYEFMVDFRVHAKENGGGTRTIPYFSLPGTLADASIASSCRTCFDYTNQLADVVVGYMGAPFEGGRMEASPQTLSIRNERGARMIETALQQGRIQILEEASRQDGLISVSNLALSTVQNDALVQGWLGKDVLEEGMPQWLGDLVASGLTALAPKRLAFGEYSIEYHYLRNYLYLVRQWGIESARRRLPQHARRVVERYLRDSRDFRDMEQQLSKSHVSVES